MTDVMCCGVYPHDPVPGPIRIDRDHTITIKIDIEPKNPATPMIQQPPMAFPGAPWSGGVTTYVPPQTQYWVYN